MVWLRRRNIEKELVKMHPYSVNENNDDVISPRTKNRVLPVVIPRDTEAISATDNQSYNKKSNFYDSVADGLSVRINPHLMTMNNSTQAKRDKPASICSDRFS